MFKPCYKIGEIEEIATVQMMFETPKMSIKEFFSCYTEGTYILITECLEHFICHNGNIYGRYYVPDNLVIESYIVKTIIDDLLELYGPHEAVVSSNSSIIKEISQRINSPVLYTKRQEAWMKLNDVQYSEVIEIVKRDYPYLINDTDDIEDRLILSNKSKSIKMILRPTYLWDKSTKEIQYT